MINPYFALSGLGMMLAALAPVMWWRYRTLVPWRNFWLGAGVWAAAVAVKVALDVTVTPLFVSWLSGIYTAAGIAIITGAYVGLRTGFFESGFTYIAAVRKKMAKYDLQQAVAFGLGFGAAEALVLGVISFLNISVLIAFPQLIDLLPAGQRAALLSQLSLPTIVVFAPIIERASMIMVHVFCSVLVIQAVKTRRIEYFMFSFIFKTSADGILPMLTLTFGMTTAAGIYSIEAFISILGTIALAGMFLLKDRYGKRYRKRSGKVSSIIFVCLATCIIIAISMLTAHPNIASQIERRPVSFDDFSGRYDFVYNGSMIGYSEFEYTGIANHNGIKAHKVIEKTNFSNGGFDSQIEGELYVTVDARPIFYNMTIIKDGERKNVVCDFEGGTVKETITEGNVTDTLTVGTNPDSFIVANNMMSHWALLFRASRLGPQNTYIAHIFSPNIASDLVRSLEVIDVRNVIIDGRSYEAYVFSEQGGNRNYVTPDGLLLKTENYILEITLSSAEPASEKSLFR